MSGRPADAARLDAFLDALPFLGRGELLAVSAAYEQADRDEREAARAAATTLARRLGRTGDIERLHGAIAQWATADVARSSAMTLGGFSDPILVDLRVQAVPALLDVGMALLLGSALDEAAAEILRAPWDPVAGEG